MTRRGQSALSLRGIRDRNSVARDTWDANEASLVAAALIRVAAAAAAAAAAAEGALSDLKRKSILLWLGLSVDAGVIGRE